MDTCTYTCRRRKVAASVTYPNAMPLREYMIWTFGTRMYRRDGQWEVLGRCGDSLSLWHPITAPKIADARQ